MKSLIIRILIAFIVIYQGQGLIAQTASTPDILKYPSTPKKHVLFDFGAAFNNYTGRGIVGFSGDCKFNVFDNLHTGLNLDWSNNNINTNYAEAITGPVLEVVSAGWITHYNWINEDNLRAGPSLNIGYMSAMLEDRDQKEPYYSKYGFRLRSKVIKTNSYFDIDPGLFLSINIYSGLWLAIKYKYRFLIGGDEFAKQSEFRGSAFVLCFSYNYELSDQPAKQSRRSTY